MITLVLICYAIFTAVMYLMTLRLYCCPGKRVSRYLGDLHASGLIVGLNCRSPDQKHPVKINILLLLLLLLRPWPAHDISTRLFFRATFAAFRAKTASDLTRASTYPSSAFDCTRFRICNSRQNLHNAFHQPSRGLSQTISHSRGGRACGRCHA